MGFYEWMLALHVLAAFAMGAAVVLFSALVYLGRGVEDPRLVYRVAPVGTVLVTAGSVLALVLGIVLAIDHESYQVWDPWIIVALVLWGAVGFTGQRSGAHYTEIQKLSESGESPERLAALQTSRRGELFHLATVALFVLLLLDMIFKPGA